MSRENSAVAIISAAVAAVVLGLVTLFFIVPYYAVWAAGMKGQASLRHAEQEKQIMIEQARAEVEAAKLRAEAIRIEGEMAQQFPEYRQQQFIGAFAEAMQNGAIQKIIYVPTEANIPIIEAGTRHQSRDH